MSEYCGGCAGEGRHRRWCPWVVGARASRYGEMAAQADALADQIGGNEPDLANIAYDLAGRLRGIAIQRATEYIEQNGTSH